MTEHFAHNLRRLRVERGLRQQDLADRACVTRDRIAQWETGRAVPAAVVRQQVARALNVAADVLAGPAIGEPLPKCWKVSHIRRRGEAA